MKFTTPCFIEIKDKSKILSITLELQKLGYKIEHRLLVGTAWKSCKIEIAPSKPNTRFIIIKNGVAAYVSNIFAKPPHAIDCGTNEALFLALAALRDDLDIHQWFINDHTGQWVKCIQPCITWMLGGGSETYHTKATPELLQP